MPNIVLVSVPNNNPLGPAQRLDAVMNEAKRLLSFHGHSVVLQELEAAFGGFLDACVAVTQEKDSLTKLACNERDTAVAEQKRLSAIIDAAAGHAWQLDHGQPYNDEDLPERVALLADETDTLVAIRRLAVIRD